MERLTPKDITKACNDPWDYCGLDATCKRDCFKPTPCKIPKMVHRLAEYEDTGLTPMQVKALFNYCTFQFARTIMTEFKKNPTPNPKEDKHGDQG